MRLGGVLEAEDPLRQQPRQLADEETDVGIEPQRLRLPPDGALKARFDEGLLGGAVVIEGEALEALAEDWTDGLYRMRPPARAPRPFRAVPYHLWANREPGAMQVWLSEA